MLRFRSQQNEQSYHVRYAYATKSMHTRAATLAPSTPQERIHPGWSCEAGRPDSQGLILLPLCCRATGIFVRSYSPLTPLSPPSEAQTSLRGSLALSLSFSLSLSLLGGTLSLSLLFFTESLTACSRCELASCAWLHGTPVGSRSTRKLPCTLSSFDAIIPRCWPKDDDNGEFRCAVRTSLSPIYY